MSLVLLIGGILFTLVGGFCVFGPLVAPTGAIEGSAIFLAMIGVFLFMGLTMLLFSRQRILEVHADFDGDGFVNGADLGTMLAEFGGDPVHADLDDDGDVDGGDMGILLANWTG